MTMPTVIVIDDVPLNEREWEAAKFIEECLSDELYPHSPSYTELSDHLQRTLDKKLKPQQIARIVQSLRQKGLLTVPRYMAQNMRHRPNMMMKPSWRRKVFARQMRQQ